MALAYNVTIRNAMLDAAFGLIGDLDHCKRAFFGEKLHSISRGAI